MKSACVGVLSISETFHEFNHSLHNWNKNIFGTEVVQESDN